MNNKPKLFCFTYAGGTKEFFNIIKSDLEGVEVVPLEYAGHGERHKEEFYHDFEELALDMLLRLKEQYNEEEYALFGYSMGSISAVEVLKRIIEKGMALPSHIFLSAHEPHTKTELLGFKSDELDVWVKKRTIEFGAVPEKLVNNKVFWRTYLPIYRADYTLIGKYEFEKLNLYTDIPVTLFYSETDTPLKEMELWNKCFFGDINYRCYEGNHFFIREHHKEMADVILNEFGLSIGE